MTTPADDESAGADVVERECPACEGLTSNDPTEPGYCGTCDGFGTVGPSFCELCGSHFCPHTPTS